MSSVGLLSLLACLRMRVQSCGLGGMALDVSSMSRLFRPPARFKKYLFVVVSYVSEPPSATLDTGSFYPPSRYSFTDDIA